MHKLTFLTDGAGAHPLFNGVQRVVVACLTEPQIDSVAGAVTVRTEGFSASFSGVELRRGQKEIVLTLLPAD